MFVFVLITSLLVATWLASTLIHLSGDYPRRRMVTRPDDVVTAFLLGCMVLYGALTMLLH
jgi:hypothetical protein